jgi:hypothetical protein
VPYTNTALSAKVFKKIPSKHRHLFVDGDFHIDRFLFESNAWEDVELVVRARRTANSNPKGL